MSEPRVHVHILKLGNCLPFNISGPAAKKMAFNLRDFPRIEAVHAGVAADPVCRPGLVGANGVGSGGDDNRIAFPGVPVVVEVRRHVVQPEDDELRGGLLELVVDPDAIFFRLAIKEGATVSKPERSAN